MNVDKLYPECCNMTDDQMTRLKQVLPTGLCSYCNYHIDYHRKKDTTTKRKLILQSFTREKKQKMQRPYPVYHAMNGPHDRQAAGKILGKLWNSKSEILPNLIDLCPGGIGLMVSEIRNKVSQSLRRFGVPNDKRCGWHVIIELLLSRDTTVLIAKKLFDIDTKPYSIDDGKAFFAKQLTQDDFKGVSHIFSDMKTLKDAITNTKHLTFAMFPVIAAKIQKYNIFLISLDEAIFQNSNTQLTGIKYYVIGPEIDGFAFPFKPNKDSVIIYLRDAGLHDNKLKTRGGHYELIQTSTGTRIFSSTHNYRDFAN
jgi:hypothetical protein